MFTELRRIIFGYNPDKYPEDKNAMDKINEADERVKENIADNGYYDPIEPLLETGLELNKENIMGMVLIGLLTILLIRG